MRQPTEVLDVETPLGPGRFFLDPAEQPEALLVLGHGAGGGVGAFDLELLARELPAAGVSVARFEQPWRTAGRKVAVAPARLDVCWRAAVATLLTKTPTSARLFFGGRSAGARVACRTAADFDVAGIVCLAFPLHLPGKPEKSRVEELLLPDSPRLVLQGSNDSFGTAAEIAAAVGDDASMRLVELPGADHGFRVRAGAPFTGADLRARILASVRALCGAESPGDLPDPE